MMAVPVLPLLAVLPPLGSARLRRGGLRLHSYRISTCGSGHKNIGLCRDGYCYEPPVADKISDEMARAEPRIKVFRRHRLSEGMRSGSRVTGIRAVNRSTGAVEEFQI